MYTDKVDDLIDKVIDEFSDSVILSDKRVKSIVKEPNFVKFQNDINDMLIKYVKTIPRNKVEEIVRKGDSINTIFNTLKKYLTTYVMLYVGFFFNGKDDTFINNVIEFSKNQRNYGLKISNFFNAESNAQIIKYYYIIKNLITLLSQDNPNPDTIRRLPHGEEAIEFINQFDEVIVRQSFMTKDKNQQAHNIIKGIIVMLIYIKYEKKDFYKLLEMSETEDGEYIFIDIVQPTQNYVDFSTIESLLDRDDVLNGLAYDLWDYLGSVEEEAKDMGKSSDDKIMDLINAGILIPIVDDFLLYHKDNEKYDRGGNENSKKKEDTKVRYIINKIDTVSELYSDNVKKDPKVLTNVKKLFYVPLHDRKAVLRNEIEEVKIINKFLNQGKRNTENNEYFNDLVTYRNYPFVNFKEFKKDGFTFSCNKTINAVRSVNFERHGEFKQNTRNKLQYRVGSSDMLINVVGFMISTKNKHPCCQKIQDIKNIRELPKVKNGVDAMSNIIKRSIVDNKLKTSVYWLFDSKKDTIKAKTYEKTGKNTKHEDVKNAVAEIYDRLVDDVYYKITDELDKQDKLTLYQAAKIINKIQRETINIDHDKQIADDIENFVFTKKLLTDDETYDENDDKLYGLTGEIYKLSDNPLKDKKKIPRLTIDPLKLDETGEQEKLDTVVGICQHNISWDDISKKKRDDPKSYMEDIYEFIKTYVTENSEKDFICKSCGFKLNIRKYATDGTFDNDTQRFITYSMPMEVPLEDIPEYEKYRSSIKILDKIIEKVASITNISYLIGSTTTTKWKRKAIVKNVIDTVLLNNSYLKHKFKDRNEKASRLYGINRNISNLFVFDLENSIFQFSSKDKDQYKPIKMNNIIAYIVIFLIMDMSDSHIGFLSSDKKFFCDFEYFDKYYKILFDGLKFIKNDKRDVEKTIKSKIFCYMLYMISCKLAKHRLWYFDNDTSKTVSKKKIPLVQKSIIHTVVDLINSVLENSFRKNTGYELEVFRTKFYEKLHTTMNSEDIYLSLKNQGRSSTVSEDKDYIMIKANITESVYEGPRSYPEEWKFIPCRQPRFYMPYGKRIVSNFSGLNAYTNTEDGDFRTWKTDGKSMTCKATKTRMRELMDSNTKLYDAQIVEKYKMKNLIQLSTVYCNSGTIHQFVDDSKSGKRKCIKCGQYEDKKYSNEELITMEKNIRKNQLKKIHRNRRNVDRILDEEKREDNYIKQVVNNVKSTMKSRSNKHLSYVNDIVKVMEGIIGNNKNILKGSRLKDNIYTIDHDHLGYTLNTPIVITDSDKKLTFKANHPHFKTDVLYYTNYKAGKIDVFYDAITKILIGHKEESKKYVNYTKSDKTLKVDYSLQNKIALMGYKAQYMDINEHFEDVVKRFEKLDKNQENKQKMYKVIVGDIINSRHQNLIKVMRDFHRVFTRIINKYRVHIKKREDDNNNDNKGNRYNRDRNREEDIDEESYFSNKTNVIVNKYIKKFSNINVADKSGKGRILKHWKAVSRGLKPESLDDIYFNYSDKLVDVNTVSGYDDTGNIMLFYLVNEMNKLLEYNDNKFVKITIVTFLIDFISTAFNMFNIEALMNNKEIKRFTYVLKSDSYLRDLEEKQDMEVERSGIYEEYKDQDDEISEEQMEKIQDDIEEQDALDIDGEIDYEANYDKSMSFEPDIDMSMVR